MAFNASGRELWVGSGMQYTRLKDAVAASKNGDTIYVKAGTYQNDFSTIKHDLHIVGVGGKAHLKSTASNVSNGKGLLVIENNADVIVDNLEFSGAQVRDLNGAGIRFISGTLSVKNSYFHNNQMHILTSHDSDASVTISNSEFAATKSASLLTHGVYVGRIASLKITDSYLHDTQNGHHIKSRAKSNLIEDNRIEDNSGDASYNIDLPIGNNATIRGNVIEQSSASGNRTMINYGGEKGTVAGKLVVEDNEFISHGGSAIGVKNRTSTKAEIEDNVFHNVSKIVDGSAILSSNTVYKDLSHVGKPAPAPTPDPQPAPSDETSLDILVRVSGDDYNGDPQFRLYVDGKQLGSTKKVTADHGDGEWQTFSFSGNVDTDNVDDITVKFLNDAWGGSAAKDRNLYVDYIEVAGTRIQAEEALYDPNSGASVSGTGRMAKTGSLVFDTDDVPLLGTALASIDDGING